VNACDSSLPTAVRKSLLLRVHPQPEGCLWAARFTAKDAEKQNL